MLTILQIFLEGTPTDRPDNTRERCAAELAVNSEVYCKHVQERALLAVSCCCKCYQLLQMVKKTVLPKWRDCRHSSITFSVFGKKSNQASLLLSNNTFTKKTYRQIYFFAKLITQEVMSDCDAYRHVQHCKATSVGKHNRGLGAHQGNTARTHIASGLVRLHRTASLHHTA